MNARRPRIFERFRNAIMSQGLQIQERGSFHSAILEFSNQIGELLEICTVRENALTSSNLRQQPRTNHPLH